jgi:hypothetical protein
MKKHLMKFAYIIMRDTIQGIVGNDYGKFVWAGDLGELLWLNADNPMHVILFLCAWFGAMMLGAWQAGFIGAFVGFAAIIPAIIAWDSTMRKIAEWAIEYHAKMEHE